MPSSEAAAPAPLTPEVFAGLPHVVAGFSTRRGGVSAGAYTSLNLGLSVDDQPEHVWENRRRLFEALGFTTEQLAVAGQVHGTDLRHVEAPGLYRGVDGLVTRTPGVLLCITAADCAAVLLADAVAGIVGACHAGWRGTAAGIVGQTVAEMGRLGAEPERLRAYISPCISAAHFEVGPEVAAQFDEAFVRHPPAQPRPYVDLKAALMAQLREARLPVDAIEVAPHCTYAQTELFFSHRAEDGRTGRMMGFIGLTNGFAGVARDRPDR